MTNSSSTKERRSALVIWTSTARLPQSSSYFLRAPMMSQIISLSVSASSMRQSLRQLLMSPLHVMLSIEGPCSGIMRAAAPTWDQLHRGPSAHGRPCPRQGRNALATSSNIMKQSINWTRLARRKWSSYWMTASSPMSPICLSIGSAKMLMSKHRTESGPTPRELQRHAFLAATQIIPVLAGKWCWTLAYCERVAGA